MIERRRREYTRGSGGMLPREILKFSFSKMHILRQYSQRDLTKKWTETYGENCMCLAANWYLFQYMQQCTNGYIQIISFQTGSCNFLLSVADELLIIPIRVSLSQVCRLNAAAAICRRYSPSAGPKSLTGFKLYATSNNKCQHCCGSMQTDETCWAQ